MAKDLITHVDVKFMSAREIRSVRCRWCGEPSDFILLVGREGDKVGICKGCVHGDAAVIEPDKMKIH